MKSPSREFCLQRADDAGRLATRTHLAKVRTSLLDAERAWRQMAEHALPAVDGNTETILGSNWVTSTALPVNDGPDDTAER